MEKIIPMELTKIKKIAADIQEFPGKIDSTELAKSARKLLKKYALLSEKIERNVLITITDKKELITLRTKKFKEIRRELKEKANLFLHSQNKKNEKPEKKTIEKAPPKIIKKAAPKKAAPKVAKKVASKKADETNKD